MNYFRSSPISLKFLNNVVGRKINFAHDYLDRLNLITFITIFFTTAAIVGRLYLILNLWAIWFFNDDGLPGNRLTILTLNAILYYIFQWWLFSKIETFWLINKKFLFQLISTTMLLATWSWGLFAYERFDLIYYSRSLWENLVVYPWECSTFFIFTILKSILVFMLVLFLTRGAEARDLWNIN